MFTLQAVAKPEGIFETEQLPAFDNTEDYWEMIKAQFAIPDNLIMANSANLCSAPFMVNERVESFIREMDRNVSFQNRAVFDELRPVALDMLSNYLNVSRDEVGITRNTTEGNCIIINGLELKKGDEIVLWDQNHQSNRESWENAAVRYGFTVNKITVPVNPQSKEDLIIPFREAITKKTRLIAFSHVSNVSGIALPAKEICKLASEHNILTLVDGAQAAGFLNLDLKDLGCDFYTASTHKWMLGPLENGYLYIKKSQIMNIWPDRITVRWTPENDTVDGRFCKLGQRNETTPPAIIEMLAFHNKIGKQAIEDRIRAMATYLKKGLMENVRNIEFVTPLQPELSGGVTIVKLPGKEPRTIFEKLYTDFGIACAPTGGIRLSPTISATMRDMDKIIDAMRKLAA
ncbi:MAG: aminotransferase class V-fold PLP-dependent enzyme [Cyclobacteriaceae bacterium]